MDGVEALKRTEDLGMRRSRREAKQERRRETGNEETENAKGFQVFSLAIITASPKQKRDIAISLPSHRNTHTPFNIISALLILLPTLSSLFSPSVPRSQQFYLPPGDPPLRHNPGTLPAPPPSSQPTIPRQ